MKLRIILLLAFLPFLTYGQFSYNSSIDIVAGLDKNYLQNSTSEASNLGYRIGINYNKKLGEKLFLKLGLRGVHISYESFKRTGLLWGSEVEAGLEMGTGPIFDPTLPHEVQYFYDYWFLEIPLAIRYELNKNRWSPFIETGLSPNLYLKSSFKEETDIGGRSFNENERVNKIQLVASVSVGVNFAATESLQLFAQPIFRYHLTKLNDFANNEHLYNIGLEIGVRKRLQ